MTLGSRNAAGAVHYTLAGAFGLGRTNRLRRVRSCAHSSYEGGRHDRIYRRAGGYGVTLECGPHPDPEAVEVAHAAILNALAHLRLTDAPPPPRAARRGMAIVEAVLCLAEGDRLEKAWAEGEPVTAGAIIARRADGSSLTAPGDGFVVFPSQSARPFAELYFFGVASDRFR